MAARALNLPHLPSILSSFAVNAGGRVKLYESGTSTPKVAYKNAAKTVSYGSVIDLNSAGQPEDGPIYAEGLYKLEMYSNNSGVYSLMYTVDPWGDNNSAIISTQLNSPFNGSFETDDDSDGDPDYFTVTDSGSNVSIDDTAPWHGDKNLKFTGSASGADFAFTDYYPISENKKILTSFSLKASNAAAQPKLEVFWYDKDQTQLSTNTLYSNTSGTTPTTWTDIYGITAEAPSSATFYKVKIIGNESATAYTVEFDDLVVTQQFFWQGSTPFIPLGLELSIDTGDSDHDLRISSGAVKDSTLAEDMVLSTAIVKKLDVSWAKGTAQGGMESGGSMTADDVLYVFLIKNPTTQEVDAIVSESPTSPTLPSGFTITRYIGAVPLNGSANIYPLTTWFGSICTIGGPMAVDIDSTSLNSDTWVTYELSAPPFSLAKINCFLQAQVGDFMGKCMISFRPTGGSSGEFFRAGIDIDGADVDDVRWSLEVHLDADSSVDMTPQYSDTPTTKPGLQLRVFGWDDLRRDRP